jgi:phage baseplate assembly protein W
MEGNFLGRGMKFPPEINPATGRFVTASGAESVKQSIYLILMTQKTERFLRPEFGSNLMNYTFIDTGLTMLNIISREITKDIVSNEPRVDDVSVEIDSESKRGCLIINIQYRVRENNTVDNLVFPFYLDTSWSTDEEESEG